MIVATMAEPVQHKELPGKPPNDSLFTAASSVADRLRNAGHEVYFAGGFARDLLIGRPHHDIDIATDAHPTRIQSLFPDSRAIGKSFGVIHVIDGPYAFDIATFRRDADYTDGRHPGSVEFTTAAEDARRRDFTVNGMFYDPATHAIFDFVGGLDDLEQRTIRAIGDPSSRFREDHLRLLRAIRFAAVLNFDIEPHTWTAIKNAAPSLTGVSPERLREELIRTLMEAPKPGQALYRLHDAGLLAVFFPELQALNGVEQPPEFHPEGDVFVHTALMLDLMEERSPSLIWSILLHDIAKPATFAIGTDKKTGNPRIQFRGHAELGAEMSVAIMKRFRCPNAEIDAVAIAIKNHMRFACVLEMKSPTLRKWIGAPTFPLELELHRIDCLASHGGLDHLGQVKAFQKAMVEEPVLPPPLVRGRDLLDLGLPAGPTLGRLLKAAYDAQLEGRITDRNEALAWVKAQVDN